MQTASLSHTRKFIPSNFNITTWDTLKPWLVELENMPISSPEDLEQFLIKRSELEGVLEEDMAWRYIRMTCDTTIVAHTEAFQFFVQEIEPQVAPFSNAFDKKVLESGFADDLKGEAFFVYLRSLNKEVEIFREENIPLLSEIQSEQQQYGATTGAMTVTVNGEEQTLQKAAVLLQSTERELRKEVYELIQNRRLQDKQKLDDLFDKLIKLRHQVALNAGFSNFRDYMFKAMGRFEFGPADCFEFHRSVEKTTVPILKKMVFERKKNMGLTALRPWDLAVDEKGRAPIKPFENGKDLLEKTIRCFQRTHPFLAECLQKMDTMGHLDLESKIGKAPGGYNYPLDETNVPFIFMNATSTLRDMVTLLHEGGHAVHSVLVAPQKLNAFKHTPSEVAELASMSMELITMDAWDEFFANPEDLNRAKREHLQQIIDTLPWVATIDKFQHWMYENPEQTQDERTAVWLEISSQFSSNEVDYSGLEAFKANAWQKQLHLFEVPFYYIEYGFAQLGAIAVWKNYKENPEKAMKAYFKALALGYTAPVNEIYAAADIRFDFSEAYIAELMAFVSAELDKLPS